jgi:hypothetical protein
MYSSHIRTECHRESCFLQDTLLIFNISLRTVFRPRQSLVVVLQLVRTERKSPRQARNGRYHQRQQHLRAVSFILRKLVSRMWMMVIRGLHHQLLRQLNLRALTQRRGLSGMAQTCRRQATTMLG